MPSSARSKKRSIKSIRMKKTIKKTDINDPSLLESKKNISSISTDNLGKGYGGTSTGEQGNKNIFSFTKYSSKLKANPRRLNPLKIIRKQKKARKITPQQYCSNYKNDTLGKPNKQLYESCKINQYCRKTKCSGIDKKFDTAKRQKLGINGNSLLFKSINNKCPLTFDERGYKSRRRCVNEATRKFYEDNGLKEIYNQVLECDKKTCAKERKVFYTNLFRANKTKKKIHVPPVIDMEELADKEIVENN